MKGRSHQLGGRVTLLDPQEGELVRAEVGGSQIHTVTISADGRYAVADCTCPHFASGAFCEHIWAVLLQLQNGVDPEDEAGAALVDKLRSLRVRAPKARKRDRDAAPRRPSEPEWMGRLSLLRPPSYDSSRAAAPMLPAQRQVCYTILPRMSSRHNGIVVDLRQQNAIAAGWSRPRALKISSDILLTLANPADRELCAMILGASWVTEHESSDNFRSARSHATYRLPTGARRAMMEKMIATGRCFIDTGESFDEQREQRLAWDGDQPWVLWMVGQQDGDDLVVTVQLRRGGQRMGIDTPDLVAGGDDGVVIANGKVAPFDDRDAYRWVSQFRDEFRDSDDNAKAIRIPGADVKRFLDRLYMLPQLPEIDLPDGVGREEAHVPPVPHLDIFSPGSPEAADVLPASSKNQVAARVWFEYDERRVGPTQPGRFVPVAPPTETAPDPETETETAGQVAEAADEPRGDEAPAEEQAAPVATAVAEEQPLPRGVLMRRDRRAEREAVAQLAPLGMRQVASASGDTLLLPAKQMPQAISHLLARGWAVSADQKLVRAAGPPSLSIASGIDWFELRGQLKYTREDGQVEAVSLPQILTAARAGRAMIQLGDGSQALLPQQWLAEHGLLTALGESHEDHLRFKTSQAAMLDALIDEHELTDFDQRFAEARTRLHQFDGIRPLDPAEDFHGSLRQYQREGLGWFGFLRWFGVGGILADDMGLGKTIQVLSMLQARKRGVNGHSDGVGGEMADGGEEDKPEDGGEGDNAHPPSAISHLPSLIVVPRSVVFNWVDEASRFTPDLRVLAYAGADRDAMRAEFGGHDVIVTSYGLLRRDIAELSHEAFDYVVLDEAQAIKNPSSQSAKACRLLQARHRLALTGTPIENHLGDLWSIFEYLNPGMLGSNARFAELLRAGSSIVPRGMAGGGNGQTPLEDASQTEAESDAATQELQATRADTLAQVAASLRPFILRRTKKQVLTDLPPKTEQTIVCEMEPAQRKVYDDLRQYYRGSLMSQLDAVGPAGGGGLGRASFMVLEALLRLRQAACHPALIDGQRDDLPSAKLDALLERVADIIEEGSKALVFSQFTSMLALVRRKLDERGIRYCYLDGQTRNRREVVDQFQNDPNGQVPLFLISLKTGGLGLNLTAAEYVFILDPWWNPAVEAQAIDRTHRIGQTKPVFAYRLICEDTVEQRIAELQSRKQQLADAIVGGQENVLRSLTRDDLEQLLS